MAELIIIRGNSGNGTQIWINSKVRENAVIGTDCKIGKNMFIDQSVQICFQKLYIFS